MSDLLQAFHQNKTKVASTQKQHPSNQSNKPQISHKFLSQSLFLFITILLRVPKLQYQIQISNYYVHTALSFCLEFSQSWDHFYTFWAFPGNFQGQGQVKKILGPYLHILTTFILEVQLYLASLGGWGRQLSTLTSTADFGFVNIVGLF